MRTNRQNSQQFNDDVAVIGWDFDNYGGDIVLALAAIHRKAPEPCVYASPRRRLRELVEHSIFITNWMGAAQAAENSDERLARLVPAATRLIRDLGKHWMADALHWYYTTINPANDPVARYEVSSKIGWKSIKDLHAATCEMDMPEASRSAHAFDLAIRPAS